MKKLALLTCLLATAIVVFSQEPQKPGVPQSEAQKTFEKIRTLAGSWEGPLTTVPKVQISGNLAQLSLRVTSRGNALMHDLKVNGIPDNPITMFYLDDDRLLLTHYCDAGNRPRMTGKISPDGKTFEFDLLDVAGGMQKGHMHHAVITMIDSDHHTEDWTFMLPGDMSVQAHFDLHRVK